MFISFYFQSVLVSFANGNGFDNEHFDRIFSRLVRRNLKLNHCKKASFYLAYFKIHIPDSLVG